MKSSRILPTTTAIYCLNMYIDFAPANADERGLLEAMIGNRWTHKRLQAAFHEKWIWGMENGVIGLTPVLIALRKALCGMKSRNPTYHSLAVWDRRSTRSKL